MSKRCDIQKEYHKSFGNYKGSGKYSDHYVSWLESRILELTIPVVVSNRYKTKKVSSDGVLFRCDNCGFEPQMASSTDDLLIMHFCPKCGSEFE